MKKLVAAASIILLTFLIPYSLFAHSFSAQSLSAQNQAARSASNQNSSATYRVTFNATWSNETHPHPDNNFPTNPHFSPLIGAAHNANGTFWQRGELASPGIKQMAETGGTSSLRSEVQAQIDSNNALAVLSGSSTTIDSFEVNQTFPLVTLVTMIAPSPDWFVGVSGVSLLDDQGQWLATHEVTLLPYDSGTDSGADYTSPNNVTDPAQPIARIKGELPFSDQPIGTLTFTLIEVTPPQWNVYLPLLQQ